MIYYFDTLTSTNSYGRENIKNLSHGDIICAQTQTEGKGRKGRIWISQEGGLYFSLILKPQTTEHIANFTQLMALTVCEAVNKEGIKAYLKWPNDVLVDGKKICGILSEAVFDNDKFEGIVLGVGINISQKELLIDKPAASLLDLGLEVDRKTFLRQIDTMFSIDYLSFAEKGFTVVKNRYMSNFPYVGKNVVINTENQTINGTVSGLNDEGLLILNTTDGKKLISLGDMN